MNPYSISDDDKYNLQFYILKPSHYNNLMITLQRSIPKLILQLLELYLPKVISDIIIKYIPHDISVKCYFISKILVIKSIDNDIDINIRFNYKCCCGISFACMCQIPQEHIPSLQVKPEFYRKVLISYCMNKLYSIDNFMKDTIPITEKEVKCMDKIIPTLDYKNFYNEMWVFKLFHDILIS